MTVLVIELDGEASVEDARQAVCQVGQVAKLGTQHAREILAKENYHEVGHDAATELMEVVGVLWDNVDMSDPCCPLANLFDRIERFLARDANHDFGDLRGIPKRMRL